MGNIKAIFVAVVAMMAVQAAAATPILVLQDTALVGAKGVEVNGKLYDVSFQDGSYNSLYPAGLSSAKYQDKTFATQAVYALGAQVFTGIYDDNPALTKGCAHTVCTVLTAFTDPRLGLGIYGFANYAPTISGDGYLWSGINRTLDTSNFHTYTYAMWSPHIEIAPVPEPSSIAMMGLGLGILGLVRRKSRRA